MNLIKRVITNTADLGKIIRAERKAAGITLQQTSDKSNVGTRFLSELERGKETAEIGKVISALAAVDLNLLVVQNSNHYPVKNNSDINDDVINEATTPYNPHSSLTLSEQLELEFPYDWSNPDIDDSNFIQLVLNKTRFNDILRLSQYFGLARLESEAGQFIDTPQYDIIIKLLSHIRIGIQMASTKNAERKR